MSKKNKELCSSIIRPRSIPKRNLVVMLKANVMGWRSPDWEWTLNWTSDLHPHPSAIGERGHYPEVFVSSIGTHAERERKGRIHRCIHPKDIAGPLNWFLSCQSVIYRNEQSEVAGGWFWKVHTPLNRMNPQRDPSNSCSFPHPVLDSENHRDSKPPPARQLDTEIKPHRPRSAVSIPVSLGLSEQHEIGWSSIWRKP